ncbi:GTP-binding protein Rhes [Hypomesus transpacificus]|uniref:GTP-binding protein Rhes n=1 Tax=Hypomesus transpacificus TaxID=137520 RepID=UPI001F081853|nr:GTP-binding protein Rhes [Hypomesus transpacificus]
MEVNTSEKIYPSVDGTAKTFNSCAGHHQLRMNDKKTIQLPSVLGVSCSSPQIFLQYKYSNVSKSSMNVIKTVKAQWRNQEKKKVVISSSTGNRQSSSDPFYIKSVDPEALVQHDQTSSTPPQEMPHTKPKNCRRVVVLGAPKVGKTNIVQRFLHNEFEEKYQPTTEDFHRKLYQIRGETYQIDILDAAMEREFPAKRRLSILTGDIFLLVFSVDDKESFKEACALRQEIIDAKTKLVKLKDIAKTQIVICGNKVDLERERVVHRSEICNAFLEEAAVFEASAKDGTGLEEMFGALAKLGGLPTETRPSQHQTISIGTYQELSTSRRDRRGSRVRDFDRPCGAVYLATRPSYSCDLQNVLGQSSTKRSKAMEKCHIQ